MCMSTPHIPAAPPPPPPPPPPADTPAPQAGAGANARARGAQAMGPLAMIFNVGGAPGLTTPPATTAKSQLGQG